MRSILSTLVVLGVATAALASDDKEKDRVTAHEALNAMIRAEAAKKQGTAPASTTAPTTPAKPADASATPTAKADEKEPQSAAAAKDSKPADAAAEKAKAKAEPATVLPKVQVNRGPINNNPIDGQIIEQEKEIAHEKQAAKPTELDKALNSPKIAKPLAIFGGESSSHRSTVTSERVQIMEEERDLLEAMKAAKTKEEKAELQKQIDQLRAYRRELEKSLR
jgi:hypothetical protein